ncbi:MAG TPA: hypothetical protein VFC19_28635 [Candidatus Limnocylindrales bacterium]|nr:hypothetical protein [Candidatus Limnocylindrales bacterium]
MTGIALAARLLRHERMFAPIAAGFMPVDTEGWFRVGRAAHGETATRMIANCTRRLP